MKIKKNIDFMSNRKKYWLISLCIIVVGILFNIIFGTELDIKFTGGALFKYSYCDDASLISASDVVASNGDVITPVLNVDAVTAQNALSEALGRDVICDINTRINVDADDKDNKMLVISLSGNEAVDESADTVIKAKLKETYPALTFSLRTSNSVDPIMGREFFLKCVVAVALATLFMIIYVAFRFKKIGGWTAGVTGVAAIVHDCIIVYFAFVICRFPIDDNFIAVVLAIIGYSLNSTIVIFDRVRENRKLLGPKASVADVTNRSINETLGRTINTNLCVFLAVAMIAVISLIYGLESIVTFAIPMMFGTVSGCYSSMFISNSLWVTWQEKINEKKLAAAASASGNTKKKKAK